jgi:segregation and condensation protein A
VRARGGAGRPRTTRTRAVRAPRVLRTGGVPARYRGRVSAPAAVATTPDAPAVPASRRAGREPREPGRAAFEVHLDNFSGPFDLLLGLITKHQLDITEVALASVTDEFIAHIRAASAAQQDWDLDEASEFLLVAATLLDLKAARLLPAADVEDSDDLALLEARDLLFARLLQYRAYKQVAAVFGERFEESARRVPRAVALEPHFERLLPELVLRVGPEQLAALAGRALTPKPVPLVGLDHLHASTVSVREQAALVVDRLRRSGSATFEELVADAGEGEQGTLVVVARFLAVLELFRERRVRLEQDEPGVADEEVAAQVLAAVDEFEGADAAPGRTA